jgi:hypothetical protein
VTTPKPPRRRALPPLLPCACGRQARCGGHITAEVEQWRASCRYNCWYGPIKPTALRAALAWNRVMRAVAEKKAGR